MLIPQHVQHNMSSRLREQPVSPFQNVNSCLLSPLSTEQPHRKMDRQLDGASYNLPKVEGERSSRNPYNPVEKSDAAGAIVAEEPSNDPVAMMDIVDRYMLATKGERTCDGVVWKRADEQTKS